MRARDIVTRTVQYYFVYISVQYIFWIVEDFIQNKYTDNRVLVMKLEESVQ